tara:strand:+ start:218 stop:1477 length:1260 start_codon:yes stop_codon:yes gene_type:complete
MKKILLILVLVVFPINTFAWYTELDNPDIRIDRSKVTTYAGDFHIPFKKNPNLDTLKYYMMKYNIESKPRAGQRIIKPSSKPYEFNSELKNFKFLNKEFLSKGIVSYLYFEKDKIIIDEISPKERLGELVNNKTKLRSNSMGKSIASYILGNAICEGYIESVESSINDWPLVKGSLYENHKLIDLLNMASGDQEYVNDSFLLKNGKRNRDNRFEIDMKSAKYLGSLFQEKKIGKKIYNYNNVNTNLILNYVLFKSKGNYQELLEKIFKEKAKIKNSVFFWKKGDPDKNGNADPMFYATRYDWLRLAKAIMNDYQNDTCVGKYLKEIYDRKIPKGAKEFEDEPGFNKTYSYGGQFHLDYPGLKNKVVFGMGGRSGQAVLIDMEDSRIIVINSIHYNKDRYKYNVKKLLINPIKKGEEAFK